MENNYNKNMQALEKRHPDFAELIKEKGQETPAWILEKKSANIKIQDSKYNEYWLYEEKEQIEKSSVKTIAAHNGKATIVFGLGMGHFLKQILKTEEPGHITVVVEPLPAVWKLAFEEYDFSEAIAGNNLFPCVGEAEVEYSISWIEGHRAIEGWNKIIDPLAYKRAEYWNIMDYTDNVLNQSVGNINTVSSHGEEIALNDIETLPWIIPHRGVVELKGLYADKPAIVVATGPSLSKNIHLLIDVCNKKSAVIIAVAQALRPLLAYGIKPDFICTVDFGEVNMSHLDGLMDQEIPLVTISKAYAPLVKAYKGPKFISATPLEGAAENSLSNLLNHRGALLQGGSVLHMALGLASCLGNNPIALIGADLSFPTGDQSHFNQADSRGSIEIVKTPMGEQLIWHIKDSRSVIHDKISSMGEAIYVEGYAGEEVVTNSGLLSFITTLESYALQARAAGINIIDSTEGGAYKKGTKRLFLQDFINRYCIRSINKDVLIPLLSCAEDKEELVDKAIVLLEGDIQKLLKVIYHTEEGIKHSKKAKKHWQKDALRECFIKNAYHTKEAHAIANTIAPMGYVLLKTLRLLESREWYLSKEKEVTALDDIVVREKAIARNLMILTEANKAADKIMQACKNALKTLQDCSMEKTFCVPSTGDINPPSIGDADSFFKENNFARPLLEAIRILKTQDDTDALNAYQRACDMREQAIEKAIASQKEAYEKELNKIPVYLDLIEKSKILGRENKYDEALIKTEQAIELLPKREEARWGAATLYYRLEQYEKSLIQYDWLIFFESDNLRYGFEAGQVMLKMPKRRTEGVMLIKSIIKKDPANYAQFEKALDDYLSGDTQ